MKLSFFLCVFLLIASGLPAQDWSKPESVNKNIHRSRFTIGGYYNQSVNTYHIYGETNYGNSAIVKSHTAYNYGPTCSYQLSRRLTTQTGIGISDFGYDMQWQGIYYPNGLYRFNVGYVEFPLEFRMTVSNPAGKLKLLGSIGGFVAVLTKKQRGSPTYVSGTTQLDLSHFDDFDQYAPTLVGLNLGMAVCYSYSDKMFLEIQPQMKLFFNKNTYAFISGDNEWTHLSSVGVRVSLNYSI